MLQIPKKKIETLRLKNLKQSLIKMTHSQPKNILIHFTEEESEKLKEEVKRTLNIIKEKQGLFHLDTFNFLKDEISFKSFLKELATQLRNDF